MKAEAAKGIEELKRQFDGATVHVREDGSGGAYVVVEPINIGSKYEPCETWIGFQITAQYPYADIYPLFIGGDVSRKDGIGFQAPITHGHKFEGRNALQISRRNSAAQSDTQKVVSKVLKVLHYLEKL